MSSRSEEVIYKSFGKNNLNLIKKIRLSYILNLSQRVYIRETAVSFELHFAQTTTVVEIYFFHLTPQEQDFI